MPEMDCQEPLGQITGYRIFGSRNRFLEPVPTFREALECLQSEEAYLPDIDVTLVAYLEDGRSIPIPDCFYWEKKKRFSSVSEAEAWVVDRQEKIDRGEPFSKLMGSLIADPNDPIDKQVHDALASIINQIIAPECNELVCEQAEDWLRAAIRALPQTR